MNNKKRGPYNFIERKTIYQNPWTTFYEDRVLRPDGTENIWGVNDVGPGTAILALDKDENVYLAKGYMYAMDQEMLVLPGGKIDHNEAPLECAKRELEEEVGLRSDSWIHIGVYHSLPARILDHTDVYLALNATEHYASDPDGENFTLHKFPLEEAVKMVMEGKIISIFASQAILYAWHHLRKNK